jgi:4-amino-4-deoxy-L-arabinose transferase-like glycosyltransferase
MPVAVAAGSQPAEARRLALSRWGVLYGAAAIAGIAMRVWWFRSNMSIPNSDESVVGLMVLHAEHGDVSGFFWGSPYAGPQEVLASVPFFALFGANYYALRVVPILLTAVTSLLIWRVGRRTIDEPAAGIAGALFWVWPPFNLFQLTQHQSFYAADVFYCALVLLCALRAAERPDRVRVGLFGLVVGLAFWQTPQIVPIAVPTALWLAWRERRTLRHWWVAALGALLGASPWIIWNAIHGFASLGIHSSFANYRHSLRLLANPVGPMTIGLRAPFGAQPIIPPTIVTYAIFAALIALFFVGAWRSRRRDASLLYVVLAIFPFLWALDRRTSFLSWPQYTVVVTPVVTLLVAQLGSTYRRGVAVLAAGCAITIVAIPRMSDWLALPQPVPTAPRDTTPLIDTLDRLRLDRVFADYWIAYRLDFATKERITAVENGFAGGELRGARVLLPHDPNVRYRPYERKVDASPRQGFVFFRRTYRSLPVVPLLEAHGWKRTLVGPYVVYSPP